jgi:DNA repair exonuclease SbcCD nuclease subunit
MEEVRVVLVADTHLGFDLPVRPRLERRRRGDDFFANFDRVVDFVLRSRPAALVHGGDFFFRSRVAPAIVERAYRRLRMVADAGVPVVIAPGNHDRSRLPASLWLSHPLISVFERARTVMIDARPAAVGIAGFPFARGDVRRALPALIAETGIERSTAGIRLLCMHQAVSGSSVGPQNYTFRGGPDVVPHGGLPPTLTAVLAGHIHRAQVLHARDQRPPVYYPGAIERTSFAERDEPKGFFEIVFGQSRRDLWAVAEARFIELPARPMVDVVVSAETGPDGLHATLESASRRLPADSVVRVLSDDEGIRAAATAALLRSAFPATMNVQVGWAVRDARGA